jgi:hypothetical protein
MSGRVSEWQFLHDFQPVTERKKEDALIRRVLRRRY